MSKQLALTRTLARHVHQDAARGQATHKQQNPEDCRTFRGEQLTEEEPEGDRAVTVGGSRKSGSFWLLFIIVSV